MSNKLSCFLRHGWVVIEVVSCCRALGCMAAAGGVGWLVGVVIFVCIWSWGRLVWGWGPLDWGLVSTGPGWQIFGFLLFLHLSQVIYLVQLKTNFRFKEYLIYH